MINLASKIILPIIIILTIIINFNRLIINLILHFIIPHLHYLHPMSLFLKLIFNLINYFHLQPLTIALRNHPNLFILHLSQNPLHHLHLIHSHPLLNFIILLNLEFINLLLLIIIPFFEFINSIFIIIVFFLIF
jgi:hypothetical protein